jgi:preprotein translocase subunit SecB
MKTGPLRLRHLYIDRILVEASQEEMRHDDEPQVLVEPGVIRRAREDPSLWKVELSLRLGPDLAPPAAYRVEMSLSGTFEFADAEFDEETAARRVAVNGLSILYTAAREHVWLETSRGRWGALSLPSVSFIGMDVAIAESDDTHQQVPIRALRRPSLRS